MRDLFIFIYTPFTSATDRQKVASSLTGLHYLDKRPESLLKRTRLITPAFTNLLLFRPRSLTPRRAARDMQTQKKERMPTFIDILFALQVGLEPTTP